MIVLITNERFKERSGTVLYVRDLALQLLARGHKPIVYSTKVSGQAVSSLNEELNSLGIKPDIAHGFHNPKLNLQTQLLREATIPVIDDLSKLALQPDIIHGHHSVETMTALLYFPRVPAVYFCHDWFSEWDTPPIFPRILRYVAVDETCYDKLVYENPIAPKRARLIFNFVDLKRFKPRRPLPEIPRRALVFSNYAKEGEHLKALRRACRAANIELDVIGKGVDHSSGAPEKLLLQYDIVFAKGRAALEALAVGTAVIVHSGISCLGQMVSDENLDEMISHNFGLRVISPPLLPNELELKARHALSQYNPADAAEVSRRVRATAGCELAADKIIALYQEVIEEHQQSDWHDTDEEMRAFADFLRSSTVLQTDYENSMPARVAKHILKFPVLSKIAKKVAGKILH